MPTHYDPQDDRDTPTRSDVRDMYAKDERDRERRAQVEKEKDRKYGKRR